MAVSKVLAVIPARGGSKTLPRKNLAPIKGIPLIGWTIRASERSKYINRTIVSTDDVTIKNYAMTQGAEVPFIRPKNLAGDDVHSVHTVIHSLDWLAEHENYVPDVVIMLLPTSPLRRTSDIDGAIKLFLDKKPDAVISVCKTSPLGSLRYIENGKLLDVAVEHEYKNFQRQDVPQLYAVNGSIYVSSPEAVSGGTFHGENVLAYEMPKSRSVDINDAQDLRLATKLVE